MGRFERKSTIVNKRFHHFLFPTILSMVAISLNEFVDSIIVSQLLGYQAMSMVNIGFPLMLAYAVIYTLFGVGGSIVYAEYAGKQESENAARSFSLIIRAAVVLSGILTVCGLLFLKPIAGAMCQDASLLGDFIPYLQALFISGLFIIPLQVLITFLPAFGRPGLGTVLNITANGVNLILDYVLIRFFQMGLKGAAYATMIGYVAGVLLIVVMMLSRKIRLPFRGVPGKEVKKLPGILLRGLGPALNQFGYCIKIAFCNSLAMKMAGIDGVAVFSLCMQVVSIVSVVICGIVGSMSPIAAALNGQGDRKGIGMLMRSVLKVQFFSNLAIVAALELFPQFILFMYNVRGSLADAAILGIRIFSVMFVFRGFILVFIYYFQIISRKVYASVLSIVDGFAGLIPLVLIFTSLMGINGLWTAFPVLSILMLTGLVLVNLWIARHSKGRYQGLLLIERETETAAVYDATIDMEIGAITDFSHNLRTFCLENGLNRYTSDIVAMASEEMLAYTTEQKDRTGIACIDLLAKVFPDRVVIDVRSVGQPFDISSAQEERFSSVSVLKKIVASVDFGYVMGMNQTRITVGVI